MQQSVENNRIKRDSRSQAAIPTTFASGRFANMPAPFRKGRSARTANNEVSQKLQAMSMHGVRLLQEAEQQLGQIIRETMKPDDRIDIAEAIFTMVYPAIETAYDFYLQKEVPASLLPDKQNGIEFSIKVMEKLTICYKQVYMDYQGKNVITRDKTKISLAAFRILEAMRLYQLVLSLQYKGLPRTEWHDCNVVFFACLAGKAVDQPFEPKAKMLKFHQLRGVVHDRTYNPNLRYLYLLVMMHGFLDASAWPLELQRRAQAYVERLRDLFQIKPFKGKELSAGEILTYEDDGAPPHFSVREKAKVRALTIKITPLSELVSADKELLKRRQLLNETDVYSLESPLKDIQAEQRMPFVRTMEEALKPRGRSQDRQAVFGAHQARLYFGFRDAYKLMMDLLNFSKEEFELQRDFVDGLASHASQFAGDEHSRKMNAWEVQDLSDRGLMVTTVDGPDVRVPDIGTFICYSLDDERGEPRPGYIARILRGQDGRLNLGLASLAPAAEAAMVKEFDQAESKKGLPTILFKNHEGHWAVIARSQYGFVPGTPMILLRASRQQIPIRLGEALHDGAEFTVFQISGPKLK